MSSRGRLLNGRYALGASPRLGGMATVFKANDLENNNAVVAVKLLNRGAGDRRLLDMTFDREYGSHRRLEHPNIVPLLDGGRDEDTGHRFLVFEWLERDLDAVLRERRGDPWGWDDFYDQIADGVLSGLARAHEASIAHRDITPGNILLTDEGAPRIADFGIAKITTDFAPGMTLADYRTEPFAPPSGEDFDYLFTRDVYAFAVVALLALSGIDPYADKYGPRPKGSIADALSAVDIPAEVHEFLERCVSNDPAERPKDANVALADLRKIAADRREAAQAAGLVGRPTYYLHPTARVREALRLDFDVTSDAEAARLLLDDLSDEVGFLTFRAESFGGDGQSTEGHLYLLGAELRLHVEIAPDSADRLLVRRVTRDSSSFLDRERERAWRVRARFLIAAPKDRSEAAADLEELRRAVLDHAAELSRREKEESQRRVFRVWRQTLQALTQLERGREQPLAYGSFQLRPGSVEFELTTSPSEDLVGQKRIAELVDGGLLSGQISRVTEESVVLRVEQGEPRDLPRRGFLRVDTRMSRAALRRQEVALDAVQRRAAVEPDLESLLLEPGRATLPSTTAEPSWVQATLDAPKRGAVQAALGDPDLMLVEGPPGTGKTTFIAEVVLQELRRNPDSRILISSQTHAALDNVLERIAKIDDSIGLLRLGRRGDERVSARVRHLLVDAQLDRWRSQIVRQGRAYLRSWARDRGLSERDVEIATRFEEIGAISDRLAEAGGRRAQLEERLEELRAQRRQGMETANETVRSVQEEFTELDLERQDLETEWVELANRLRELGEVSASTELEGLTGEELRLRAEQRVDRDHEYFEACRTLLRLLGEWHGRFGRGPEFEAAALVRAQVVAGTCVGLGGTPGWEAIEFDVCIIDEASKATATELLIPMSRSKRWVLVGDHRQLPPYVDEALLDRQLLSEFNLTEAEVKETLFERLRRDLPETCRFLLSTQHRMVPAIGNLISESFYEGELTSAGVQAPSWLSMALPAPVVWLSTAHLGGRREQQAGTSHTNPLEARCIRNLLGSLNLLASASGDGRLAVGVLTGYAEQRDEIERRIADKRGEWSSLDIECNTVDAFQGREVDVAIYSVTRSNLPGRLGFLQERRRLNVALSRGRLGLAIVGDDRFARSAHGDNPFAAVLAHVERAPGCSLEEAQP